jgi:hypothetical protein
MFKSKQALVCMAIFISRRFDRSTLSAIFIFGPVLAAVIFCTERIFHHEPNEKTKIKVPLHKKSGQKKARSKKKRDRCRRIRGYNMHMPQGRKVSHVRAQMPIHSSGMDANLILHLNPWRATFSNALATPGSTVSRE